MAKEAEERLLCTCKQTREPPFCDGAHNNVPGAVKHDDEHSPANRAVALVEADADGIALLDGGCYVRSTRGPAQWQQGTLAVQRLIGDGRLTMDGQVMRARDTMVAGQTLHLSIPPVADTELRPEPIPISVVYEDDDILVVDKPVGLVVHPAPGHASGTLVNALLHHVDDLPGIAGDQAFCVVCHVDHQGKEWLKPAASELSGKCETCHGDRQQALAKAMELLPKVETEIGRAHV